MLLNYIKIAVRNLRRNGKLLLINVSGLGLALGFCILSYINYRFAHSFDGWHRAADRIARVEIIKKSNGEAYGVCAPAVAAAAREQIAGVESATTYDVIGTVVKQGENVFNEPLHFTDEVFRQIFDFEVLAGSDDLSDRSRVLITEEAAEKYFGQENPVGKSLMFFADTDHKKMLTVGGVLKTPRLNSSIRFKFLTHRDNRFDGDVPVDYTSWKKPVDAVFLKLKKPSDFAQVQAEIQSFTAIGNAARPDWLLSGYRLTPLRQLALQSRDLNRNALWQGVPPASVWGNITISGLLLLTAALNFANMTIAACNRRLREMGVRKVMGGTRFQLMRQILVESMLVVALATGVGMLLAYPICDWFNSTWKFTDFHVDYSDPRLLAFLAGVLVFTTLLAGSYPAFYISAFRPLSIFRGGTLFGGKNVFSRVMMGLQVVISIISVVTGLSFARNAEHNRTADIGFAYRNVLQAWLQDEASFHLFDNAVRNIPGITASVGTRHLPGFGNTTSEFSFNGEQVESLSYEVGNGFLQTMEFRLQNGAFPTPAGDTTVSSEIVVNDMFVREIAGGQDPVGKQVILKGVEYRISGVVSDFMTNNPFSPIRPALIRQVPASFFNRCVVKTGSEEQAPRVMASIEKEWKKLFPYTPFNVGYQNEMLMEAAEVSGNIAHTMSLFSLITVLLGGIGLFSLISLDVLRRTREVAIRRVMGATSGHITWILNKNLLWILALSVAAGCVAGRFFALLLMDSIFSINTGVQAGALVFGATGVIAVVLFTIALKIWQTLRVNPADVLRGD
ncbi:MAG: ABC transporter permease [Saprospiraceae bacterium]|nr:ABC transporter permease [Saprospiraceae bacterium]